MRLSTLVSMALSAERDGELYGVELINGDSMNLEEAHSGQTKGDENHATWTVIL